VNKAVNKKEHLEKGMEEEEKNSTGGDDATGPLCSPLFINYGSRLKN
jgi:hypothetical protein